MERPGFKLPAGAGISSAAQTGVFKLTVNVFEFGADRPIADFKFIVNQDTAGDPFHPEHGNQLSPKAATICCPVVATGDADQHTVSLPPGKYLVSVLAPGYKLGGNWVTLSADGELAVELLPYPLPLSTIRVRVFEDNRPVNGSDDFPFERGLPDFRILLHDAAGEVTVDYAGNPLGTVYKQDAGGNLIIDPDGRPVPLPGTGGVIRTDENGDAVIENLLPGRYKVLALPPEGTDWIQSTTVRGTRIVDTLIEEGNDGYTLKKGFVVPLVCIGFVKPKEFVPGKGTGTITGRVRTITGFEPPVEPLKLGDPIDRPWIALTDIRGNNEQVYTGRGNPDGTFSVPNVPAGLYRLATWDGPLEHIISFRTVQVREQETVLLGDIGIPRWPGSAGDPASPEGNGERQGDPAPGKGVAENLSSVSGESPGTSFAIHHTGVPLPGRIVGLIQDAFNLETNPEFIHYGKKRGIPDTPIGIRDYTGRLLTTVHSDANGFFEVLLPSTCMIDVPTPSGLAPGMYLIIANDPGDPDRPNKKHNPHYQTLKQVVDVCPGRTTYTDVALQPRTAFVETPESRFSPPPVCLSGDMPQLNSVSRVHITPDGGRRVIIRGRNFGRTRGKVTLNETPVPVLVWKDRFILARIPVNFPPGPAQLTVTTSAGLSCIPGITIHVLIPGVYYPPVVTATPETTIQEAIDNAPAGALVIIRPGVYYESPILYKNVKLQGMGAGVTKLDGRYFTSYQETWENKLDATAFDGPQELPRGQVVTVVARDGSFNSFNTQIDGVMITGANGEEGGGIVANAYCHQLEISNSIIQGNSGGFGGGIIIGRPFSGDGKNTGVRIHHNRIMNNGGAGLAGGVGIFSGAHGYEFAHNEVYGNCSAGCGGGFSHYGLSHYGRIHHNRFLFNTSFTEGAGIFVGGEEAIPPEKVSSGSGAVDICDNLIQFNLANGAGGGIHLLRTGLYRINLLNNVVVSNVSTYLGGGLALGDSSNVVVAGNTFAKNITTAIAEGCDGRPHAAGIASQAHSAAHQAVLPDGAPDFSDPTLFNNLFSDNRAGWYEQTAGDGCGGIAGISADNDPGPVNVMDLEVFGTPAPRKLAPRWCTFRESDSSPGSVNLRPYGGRHATNVTVVACCSKPALKNVKILITPTETQVVPDEDFETTPPVVEEDRKEEIPCDEKSESSHAMDSPTQRPEGPDRDLLPPRLSARVLYANWIKLTWFGGSTAVEGYIIERSMMCENAFTEIARVSAGTAEYIDICLFQRTRYFYRLKAYNSRGVIVTSNIAVAMPSGSLAKLPLAPLNLRKEAGD